MVMTVLFISFFFLPTENNIIKSSYVLTCTYIVDNSVKNTSVKHQHWAYIKKSVQILNFSPVFAILTAFNSVVSKQNEKSKKFNTETF